MRTKYAETYQIGKGPWIATTTDLIRPLHAPGRTELEALGELFDRLYEVTVERVGYPEEWR